MLNQDRGSGCDCCSQPAPLVGQRGALLDLLGGRDPRVGHDPHLVAHDALRLTLGDRTRRRDQACTLAQKFGGQGVPESMWTYAWQPGP
ncbi:hypothetical protein N801_04030 [Knoellia aerolata DSM 18566]|uniref:Uncharacterized protein n=1 Tax=Knoellia aerolata DSM 18566 TaxID=1385519 RepID=A0A0A0JXE9_9MICO|nr:hypothetical protein N801_04030 [Knoellia aerolata DSM 18566]